MLARTSFRGKELLSLIIYVPLVFPPVVSGIVLLLLYGPYGLIGGPLANMGLEVDDSLAGIVVAQIFVSAPFLIVAARSAFEAIDPALEAGRDDAGTAAAGACSGVSVCHWPGEGILAGLILAWMRALGEFGGHDCHGLPSLYAAGVRLCAVEAAWAWRVRSPWPCFHWASAFWLSG